MLKRYLWLIDTLQRCGDMTYHEIASRWERSSVNDGGMALSQRTLYNHRLAISNQFGIDIECRRGRGVNVYYIANPEAIEENTLTKWALASFSLGQLMLGNADIADKILLEDIPSGQQWLATILKALQENKKLEIEYRNFFGKGSIQSICPLAVKLFKRRWYMVALNSDSAIRKYSLDRISRLELCEDTFKYPADFYATDYFNSFFGIVTDDKSKCQRIVVRAYEELPLYLKSLPLHNSQREIAKTDSYTDFEVTLVPTFDFIQELLLHGSQVEVLHPASLRDELKHRIAKMSQLYK